MNYRQQQKELVRKLEETFARGAHKPTVVDMRKNYANDDQRCFTSVVFVPDAIAKKITWNVIDRLQEIEPHHYFYPPESMHITVKNIRTVHKPPLFTESDIEKVKTVFKTIIPKFPVFEFHIEDVIIFPTSVSIMAYAHDTLQKLVRALDKGLRAIGVPDNKKYLSDSIFWGNITICRFVKNPDDRFIREVKKMRNDTMGKFNAETVRLITCNAVCAPASREIIAEYQLSFP